MNARFETLCLFGLCIAACGGATVAAGAGDASSDANDASVTDDGGIHFGDGFAGFEGGTGDALVWAKGACDPPCDDGEYCYAFVTRGGGRRRLPLLPMDGGDASIGCHAVPSQCAPSATCACLLQVIGPACHASTTDCLVDDAGRPTVECIEVLP